MDLNQIEPIARMINEFSKLPSVGRKSAERYAYHIIRSSDEQAKNFADAIINLKAKIKFCDVCGNYTEQSPCKVCRERTSKIICVVKEPKDAMALKSFFQESVKMEQKKLLLQQIQMWKVKQLQCTLQNF